MLVKILFLLGAMIGCTVIANLIMKVGAADAPAPALLGIFSWRTLAGFTIFGVAGLLYAAVLRFLPLNVAQSYAAAQFISVILASRLVLGEPIALERWIGISLILVGIVVVAMTQAGR